MFHKAHSTKHVVGYILLAVSLIAVVVFGRKQSAAANDLSADAVLAEFTTATNGNLETRTSDVINNVDHLFATDGVLAADNNNLSAETRATNFLQNYGAVFGIDNAAEETVAFRTETDIRGMEHVRLEQLYQGLPVFGAELIVHMNDEGITGVNGNFIPKISIDTTPTISAVEANEIALRSVAHMNINATLHVADTSLQIYRHNLFKGTYGENALTYAVEVRGESGDAVGDLVFVSAENGDILDTISLVHTIKYRRIYSPVYVAGTDVFNEDLPPPSGTPHGNLFDFAGGVYDLFLNAFGRENFDGDTTSEQESVYLINQNCPNAYWDGSRTNYCPGFDLDDVVAHEWGHGYTQETHGLIYSYQSGALNESYSDIWGEVYDLHNGVDDLAPLYTNDNSQPYPDGVRWIVGEGLSEPVVDLLLRDMWDPERLGYPATPISDNYHCAASDSGGVHHNSSVPNLAFAMLVDGREFNGQTIEAIGFHRAIHLYYHASTVYQHRSTDFVHHAEALRASCQDLIGEPLNDFLTGEVSGDVIDANTCTQVDNALEAVMMETEPLCDFNFERILHQEPPALCSTEGKGPETFYIEDWENGMDDWTLESNGTSPISWPDYNWEIVTDLPQGVEGSAAFAIDAVEGDCALDDVSGQFAMTSPVITVPDTGNALEMSFRHLVDTERDFDGGNLLISINGGAFELVPDGQYRYNAPNTTLEGLLGTSTNPKGGEAAWSGVDQGFIESAWGTTIVDLDGLGLTANDTFQLKFDFGTDACNGVTGWFVDTINAVSCTADVVPTMVELSSVESGESAEASNGLLIALFATVTLLSVAIVTKGRRA